MKEFPDYYQYMGVAEECRRYSIPSMVGQRDSGLDLVGPDDAWETPRLERYVDGCTDQNCDATTVNFRTGDLFWGPRALEVLMPLVHCDCVLRPVDCADTSWTFALVTTRTDALDRKRSNLLMSSSAPERILVVSDAVLDGSVIRGRHIFKLAPQLSHLTFVSREFVELVEANGLTGFRFRPVMTIEEYEARPPSERESAATDSHFPVDPENVRQHRDLGPLLDNILDRIHGNIPEVTRVLAIPEGADAKSIVHRIDQEARLQRSLPRDDKLGYRVQLLACLWGEQFVHRFQWQWRQIEAFGDLCEAVIAPDFSLYVLPFEFLSQLMLEPEVPCTVALAFNMLEAGSVPKLAPKAWEDLMKGVHPIIP